MRKIARETLKGELVQNHKVVTSNRDSRVRLFRSARSVVALGHPLWSH